MIKQVYRGYREVSRLDKLINISEVSLIKMEDTYHSSKKKLQELGIAAYQCIERHLVRKYFQ